MTDQAIEKWDHLWLGASLATMEVTGTPYGAIEDGAIAARDGRIAYVGPHSALPGAPADLAERVHDVAGTWITPGLIDCHTHIVFGGDRAREFEMRLSGATYEDIARAGGGILSSVEATRAAREEELVDSAAERISRLMSDGVTTIEIKSGYGLETRTELKMLRAARALDEILPIRTVPTFLGAHAIPADFSDDPDAYIDLVIGEMLPAVKESGLASAVDGYLEEIAFDNKQIERLFKAARELGFALKLHADQLSDGGGAALAAGFGALSADHLEYTSPEGVEAMAAAGTVAVLLPGAFHTLGETQKPPVGALREAGVPVAVATDCNPGTSPVLSLRLMMNMAAVTFGLTAEEALAGVTRNAALALGLGDEIGTLEVGKRADLAIWTVTRPAALSYWLGGDFLAGRVFAGAPDPAGALRA